ncbi:Na+/H+ antiporter NhaC [Alcanivorax nanhaiticus]|uniref:Na+/H+ antiporter NhaC n=1 Tax=Alcanivorax nanhaiticus TaxID=1177154 RepID=A0A095SG08_9GAMM|nr:Na+/H+ antiporter NhaC [Alcanivorax nanhaiticus]KGD63526.1 Na+/H+ antiporter NhaC [Alcanivorax nanhaiticus]
MTETRIRRPSLPDALFPIVVLIALLAAAVYLYGDDASYGPNQIALLFCAGLASLIGLKNGLTWREIETAMVKGISVALGAILILLMVGALIGTWRLAGIVPSLIYFGLELMNPSLFYAAACLICAVIALSIGSSWTVAATVGVALIGVASGLGLSLPVAAGAVVSGAYFGDKISPLSETTNLAPAVAGSELFEHIRLMLWTTVPSIVIALLIFLVMGLSTDIPDAGEDRIAPLLAGLESQFHISIIHLVPLGLLLFMALKRMPALPAIFIGALVGGVWALLFQPDAIAVQAGVADPDWALTLQVVWQTFFAGITVDAGDAALNDLLSGGGMASMMNTVWLIMCAMAFGAVMEKAGLLARLIEGLLGMVKGAAGLITATLTTCFGSNILTADQYISIIMPGRMFREEYERQGLAPVNLSRALEDGGTITSPLIPWNTCGAYMQSVLLVPVTDYLFFAFFNLINPVLALAYAWLGIKVLRLTPPVQAGVISR